MEERELHDLMIRLDERTLLTLKAVNKLEEYQGEQNGFIRTALINTKTNRNLIKVICGVGGVLATTLIGWFSKIAGLW